MNAVFRAVLSAAVVCCGPAVAQVPASNSYERQMQDLNRSIELRQRDIQQQQQREFESNQRSGRPRTERMPGERPRGCPVGSAGC